jgi:hypothetical protein
LKQELDIKIGVDKYLDELTSWVHSSPAYNEESKSDVIWRTMICGLSAYGDRAPPEYKQYWQSYLRDSKRRFRSGYDTIEYSRIGQEADIKGPATASERDELIKQELEAIAGEAYKYLSTAYQRCHRLRMATLSSGVVGMVPRRANINDIVAVLKGVPVPMVLRKKDGFEDKYTLVGQAYFDGFMDGEVLENHLLKEEVIIIV